jgi:hypothetical protein
MEAYMVINFKIYRINRNMNKLAGHHVKLKKKKQAVVTSFAQLSHDNGTHNGQDKQSKQSLCARVKLESDEA